MNLRSRSRCRSRSGAIAAVPFVCMLLPAMIAHPAPVDAVAPDPGGDVPLAVVAHTFDVVANTPVSITVQMSAAVAADVVDADTTVVVTSYGPVLERETFLDATNGVLPRSIDTFDISLDPADTDPNVSRSTTNTLLLTIPTESTQRSGAALQLAQTGVHPVVIDIRRSGRLLAEAITFVHRLSAVPTRLDPLPVALVLGQASTVEFTNDGSVVVSAEASAELERLTHTLEAIDASVADATPATVAPRLVQVEPTLVEALDAHQPALAARLKLGLSNSTLSAMPRLPFDVSAAVEAQQNDRYLQQLRQGDDLLRTLVDGARIDRSVLLADASPGSVTSERGAPLTDAGATFRRNLAAQLLIMPFDRYSETDGNTGLLIDTTQLVTTVLADGTTLPTAVIDPYLSERLDRTDGNPYGTATELVAELLVLRNGIVRNRDAVGDHGVVLADSALGVPDPALIGHVVSLLLNTDGLELTDVASLSGSVDTWLVAGRPQELTLPTSPVADLTERFTLIDDVARKILAYTSVVPDGDPRAAVWGRELDVLPSTAVSEEQAATMARRLDEQFATIRSCVKPPEPFGFTLTGDNTFRFKVQNTCATDLRVRIRLDSAKLAFPDGDQLETLIASSDTLVEVSAEALSNGKSSVFLRIFSPAVDTIAVADEVPLTARVNSLAGLGQLLTGAGLLLVVTWWANNWRRSRRKLQASRNVSRHPAVTAAANDPASDDPVAHGPAATQPAADDTPGSSTSDQGPGEQTCSVPQS